VITENYAVCSCTVKNKFAISLLPQFEYRFAERKRENERAELDRKRGERNRKEPNDVSIYVGAYIGIQNIDRERSSCTE